MNNEGLPKAQYELIDLLLEMKNLKASDLHLTVGKPPAYRVYGSLITSPKFPNPLRSDDTLYYVNSMINEMQKIKLERDLSVDFSFGFKNIGRFRINVFLQRATFSIAIRLLPNDPPSINDLGLPPVIQELTKKKRGLILVTGPTGSGKSTTLAAMIKHISDNYPVHILTIEDPIEYVFRHGKGITNQREIGSDAVDFASALKYALREDPDVIMVGEMRDLESISAALTLAETGHLVLGTLHTKSAAESIDRIVDIYPSQQQPQIRTQLATVLEAIISQRLIPKKNNDGMVLAYEILIAIPAVRAMIREGKTQNIPTAIQTNIAVGMIDMERRLYELLKRDLITLEVAFQTANSPKTLEKMIEADPKLKNLLR